MGQEQSALFCTAEPNVDYLPRSRQFMLIEEISVPSTVHGESPHWCSITGSLFYVDIKAKTIYQYVPSTKRTESMTFNSFVGFAIPTSRSTTTKIILFVGLESEIVEVNFTTKEILRVVSTLPEDTSLDCRFNDGKCNHEGRLYTGYMHSKWRDGKRGNVYQLIQSQPETDDTLMELQPMFGDEEFHLPNGSTWKKNGTVYFIDSGNNTINCYTESVDTDESDYGLRKVSCVYTLNAEDHTDGYMLDGMTIDNDGKLWVRFEIDQHASIIISHA